MNENELRQLMALENELEEGRRLSRALLEKLDKLWKNSQYLLAFELYATHLGNYLYNGGIQIIDEQEALNEWVSKK
jgi:hypothetical protein